MTSEVKKLMAAAQKCMEEHDEVLFNLAVLTLFLGAMRPGELLPDSRTGFDPKKELCYADVTFDATADQSVMTVKIKNSKTDQFSRGRKIPIFEQPGSVLNIIPHYMKWVEKRFIGGLANTIPFLVNEDGSPFVYTQFKLLLARACVKAGLPHDRILPHSFRKGAATVAHAENCGEADLKVLGNWKSGAYKLYVTPTAKKQKQLQQTLTESTL
jgi:hypothetical protein